MHYRIYYYLNSKMRNIELNDNQTAQSGTRITNIHKRAKRSKQMTKFLQQKAHKKEVEILRCRKFQFPSREKHITRRQNLLFPFPPRMDSKRSDKKNRHNCNAQKDPARNPHPGTSRDFPERGRNLHKRKTRTLPSIIKTLRQGPHIKISKFR